MNTIDLHMHTNYSDGKYTPSELLLKVAEVGLKTIAITDHDNAGGARQAIPLAKSMGLELIPGIEATTSWQSLRLPPGDTDVDLLGYFVDFDSPEFKELEKSRTDDISERMADLCARLNAAGFPLTLADIREVNPNFPSTTAAIFALQRKGYAAGFQEGRRVVMESWQQVRPANAEIGEVIGAIHAAGGVAVLAHPAAIASPGRPIGKREVGELAELGLDGIEVYHHRNDEGARRQLLALAQRFNLVVSGGSDEHGWWSSRLGTQPITDEMVETLKRRARR